MAEIAEAFGQAAVRVRDGGFDGIEIEWPESLLRQFLSPISNHRGDEYGGSLENRMRFPLKILETVRRAVGGDLTIGVCLCADESSGAASRPRSRCRWPGTGGHRRRGFHQRRRGDLLQSSPHHAVHAHPLWLYHRRGRTDQEGDRHSRDDQLPDRLSGQGRTAHRGRQDGHGGICAGHDQRPRHGQQGPGRPDGRYPLLRQGQQGVCRPHQSIQDTGVHPESPGRLRVPDRGRVLAPHPKPEKGHRRGGGTVRHGSGPGGRRAGARRDGL